MALQDIFSGRLGKTCAMYHTPTFYSALACLTLQVDDNTEFQKKILKRYSQCFLTSTIKQTCSYALMLHGFYVHL